MNNNIYYTIFVIIIACIYYLFFIKPIKLFINSEILYPFFSKIIFTQKIKLSDSCLTIISLNDAKKLFHLPFGGSYYFLPIIMLSINKNWFEIKRLSNFHLFLALIQFIVFLFPINSFWIISFANTFHNLSILLGLTFVFISSRDLYLHNNY